MIIQVANAALWGTFVALLNTGYAWYAPSDATRLAPQASEVSAARCTFLYQPSQEFNMTKLTTLIVAAGLTVSGFAYAQPDSPQTKGTTSRVEMSDSQLDKVVGGALINAVLVDVVDVNNNDVQVAIPVNAAVAAGILGTAGAAALQQPGRQIIR